MQEVPQGNYEDNDLFVNWRNVSPWRYFDPASLES